MLGINALVSAFVSHHQSIWDFTNPQLVGDPMSEECLAINVKSPVSIFTYRPSP